LHNLFKSLDILALDEITLKIAEILLEAEADINLLDSNKDTPLTVLLENQQVYKTKMREFSNLVSNLLILGADVYFGPDNKKKQNEESFKLVAEWNPNLFFSMIILS
jgi:hypothetical protein